MEDSGESKAKAFMTPTQQREYLAQLRKQNEDLYNLTGARSRSTRDPSTVRGDDFVDLTATKTLLSPARPPKPPKSFVAKTSSFLAESAVKIEKGQEAENELISPNSFAAKPRTLPKPSRQSEKNSNSTAELAIPKRSLPPVPTKPQGIRTLSSRSASSSERPQPVIPAGAASQLTAASSHVNNRSDRHGIDHEERTLSHEDDPSTSKKVTIPIFSFPDAEGYVERYT